MRLFRLSILLITASFVLNIGLAERSFSAERRTRHNSSKFWKERASKVKSKHDLLFKMLILAVTEKNNKILTILRSEGHIIFKSPQVWNRRTFQKFILSLFDSLTMMQLKQLCESNNLDGNLELLPSYVIVAPYYIYAPDKTFLIKLRPRLKRVLTWSWRSENAARTLNSIVKAIDVLVGPGPDATLINVAKDVARIAREHSIWTCNQTIENFFNAKKNVMPWEGVEILINGLKFKDTSDNRDGAQTVDRIIRAYFNMHIREMSPTVAAEVAMQNKYWNERNKLIEWYYQTNKQHLTWEEIKILLNALAAVKNYSHRNGGYKTMDRIIRIYFNMHIRKMTPTIAAEAAKQIRDWIERNKLIELYYQTNKQRLTWEEIEILLNALKLGVGPDYNGTFETMDRIIKTYFSMYIQKMTPTLAVEVANRNYYWSEKSRLIEQYFQAHKQHLTLKEFRILINGLQYATQETEDRIFKDWNKVSKQK